MHATTSFSSEASVAQLIEHALRKCMAVGSIPTGGLSLPSPKQALVPVRTSQSRRPAAAVIVPLASSERAPSGFAMPLAGEPALPDSLTEWRRRLIRYPWGPARRASNPLAAGAAELRRSKEIRRVRRGIFVGINHTIAENAVAPPAPFAIWGGGE
jgi:hypothetical protein